MAAATISMTLPGESSAGAFRSFFQAAGRVMLIGLGLSIPLSTSGGVIFAVAYGVCWLLSGDCLKLPHVLRRNPVAVACLAMFGLLLVGTTYGPTSSADVLKTLLKYRELLYVPIFLTAFADERARVWGLRAFLTGVMVLVGLSYAEWLFRFDMGLPSPTDYVISKDRIIHGLLVSFAMFLVAHQAWDERKWRWLRLAFIALAVFNILVLVQGRTGHLVMSLLALLFMFQRKGVRGLALGVVLLAAFWTTVYKVSPIVQKRIHFTVKQINDQLEAKRNDDARLEFYQYSLKIIRQNPLTGTGTGGFLYAYREIARVNGVPATEDPHSEYLLLAVQLGLFGPVALLCLLGFTGWTSRRLPAAEQRIAQGLLVTIGAGCLVNSLMYGFTGGLLFGFIGALAFATYPSRKPADQAHESREPLRLAA